GLSRRADTQSESRRCRALGVARQFDIRSARASPDSALSRIATILARTAILLVVRHDGRRPAAHARDVRAGYLGRAVLVAATRPFGAVASGTRLHCAGDRS